MNSLSYSTFMTLSEGEYQLISHENNSFGGYIDKSEKVNLLFISDEPMFNVVKQKKLTLKRENKRGYLSISDINVSINDIFIRHNLSSLEDILEEKDLVNTIHTIDISIKDYDVLDSIVSEKETIDLYFYHIIDKNLFKKTFMSEIALKKSESGVPRTEELGRIFEFNNFNYFDVFPIFKGFNENLEDMNIIAGAELFKLKVEIKK